LARELALIFDMDGVIIDSNPVHRQVWAAYNRRFGIETDEAMQQRMYGRRNDDIVRDFFGAHLTLEEVRAHGAAKEQLFRETIGPVLNEALVPGLREFLEQHRHQPLGVATNAEPENVGFLWIPRGYARTSGRWWTAIRSLARNHIPIFTCERPSCWTHSRKIVWCSKILLPA
jgi:beta-phosphoglucomutase-like phosphatase (HAD superfamily)